MKFFIYQILILFLTGTLVSCKKNENSNETDKVCSVNLTSQNMTYTDPDMNQNLKIETLSSDIMLIATEYNPVLVQKVKLYSLVDFKEINTLINLADKTCYPSESIALMFLPSHMLTYENAENSCSCFSILDESKNEVLIQLLQQYFLDVMLNGSDNNLSPMI